MNTPPQRTPILSLHHTWPHYPVDGVPGTSDLGIYIATLDEAPCTSAAYEEYDSTEKGKGSALGSSYFELLLQEKTPSLIVIYFPSDWYGWG